MFSKSRFIVRYNAFARGLLVLRVGKAGLFLTHHKGIFIFRET